MKSSRQAFTLLSIVALLLGIHTGVHAHTPLRNSIPPNKAELTESPKELKLEFGSPVRLLKLTLLNGEEQAVDINFTADTTAKKVFSQELPELQSGAYRVEWSALGHDGHKMSSKFSFTVSPQP